MGKKVAYIAGKVTGLPLDRVAEKFRKKQHELELRGYIVMNPVEIVEATMFARQITGNHPMKGWSDEMRICIPAMLQCDELHLLPCWQDSRGATLERDIALRLGMKIVYH